MRARYRRNCPAKAPREPGGRAPEKAAPLKRKPRKTLGPTLLTALVLASSSGTTASAQTAQIPNYPGFGFGTPAGEALLALGIGLSNAASALPQRDTGWGPDASHPHDPVIDRVSDFTGAYGGAAIAVASGYAFERAYFDDAGSLGGPVYSLHGALVDVESAALARGVVDALKRLTGRCRPRYFVNGQCTTQVRDAFPSGHTAPMGAIAGARLLFALNTEGPPGFRWASFGVAETMALATGVLRVKAGMHSWTDVGTGIVLGHALGLLVALAHPMRHVDRTDYPPPETTSQGGFGLTWGGTF